MAETKKNWYVLRAVSGKEAKLKEYIEAETACFSGFDTDGETCNLA